MALQWLRPVRPCADSGSGGIRCKMVQAADRRTSGPPGVSPLAAESSLGEIVMFRGLAAKDSPLLPHFLATLFG